MNRRQYVTYNDTESDTCFNEYGVPQGSILGPLLFLVYENDMVSVSPSLLPILFADDTNIFLSGKKLRPNNSKVKQRNEGIIGMGIFKQTIIKYKKDTICDISYER